MSVHRALACPPPALELAPTPPAEPTAERPLLNDVHSRLNPTRVDRLVSVAGSDFHAPDRPGFVPAASSVRTTPG